MQTHLSWEALEYEHTPRSSDWFWGLGIIATGGCVLSIILGNSLLGLVIAVGALALGLHALRHPRMVRCDITDRGVAVGDTLFPYTTLESFWIHERTTPNQLVLTSKKIMMPHIVVMVSDVSTEDIRDVLLEYLDEVEVHETFSDRVLELFGF